MKEKKLSEVLLENLRNIVDVEEKSKEVVKPDFAAAVREIKDNDEKRDEANEKVEAPKEGEETLPKSMKLILDESLFEDDINREESISLEQYLDEINEAGGWVTLEKIEMDVFHTPVDANAADVINYAVHHGWKVFDHPEHGLAIMHQRLEGKKLPESFEDEHLGKAEEAEEEKFWVLVYMLVDEDIERTERYDDIDDARADFITFTERDPKSYKYVVLQEVTEGEEEDIEELEVWGDVYESLKENAEKDKLEESAELLTRIKSEVKEDIKPDMTIRSAYAIVEPDEFQLDHLRDDITIEEVWKKMQEGEEIYEIASVDGKGFDSAVREGIFGLIEKALGVPYEKVYETWLDVRPIRKRNVIEGIKRKK